MLLGTVPVSDYSFMKLNGKVHFQSNFSVFRCVGDETTPLIQTET